jgi:hypothetical protein
MLFQEFFAVPRDSAASRVHVVPGVYADPRINVVT